MAIKSTKNRKIPKLRFPQFSDNWNQQKLKNCVDFLKGKGISKDDIAVGGKNKCIRYGELYTDYNEVIRSIKSSTNILNKNYVLSVKNDTLIPSSGETALDIARVSCVLETGVMLGGDLNIMRPKDDYSGIYLAYYLSNFQKRNIAKMAQGNSVVHLYESHIKNLEMNIPCILEQKKIAEFLESIDSLLENSRKQKESLEAYKKGIIQKIFTQKIRFKDEKGKSFPKWEEKKLGAILKERKEYSIKGKGYTHISLTTKGVVPKSERYDRDFLVGDDDTKGYKITRLNDLCYNPANLKFGVISINKLSAGIFSPIYVTFEIIDQNIDFVGYYLIRDAFINKARRYEQGTVYERMAVHPDDFVKVKVVFPSLPEQEKIANFLKSIDREIELKQQQITAAEQWKKGLMQGLFI